MANILVVLEKCPLSSKEVDRRAGLETANHQRHLPENNRTKCIDLSLITQFWPELQGYSSIIPLAERQQVILTHITYLPGTINAISVHWKF
jgi:hypothetical protein